MKTTYVTIINDTYAVTTTHEDASRAFLKHVLDVHEALYKVWDPDALGFKTTDTNRWMPYNTYLDGFRVGEGKFVLMYELEVDEFYWDKRIGGMDY